MTTTTFGAAIGSALGKSAAYAAHGAISAGRYTGQFGADLVAGTREGYATKSAELAERRAQLVAQAPVAVRVKRAARA